MPYVDGFVIPIPKKNVSTYRRLANKAGRIWMEQGALQFCECVGDELKPHCGVGFPRQLKLKRGETVLFSWIVFKSLADRNRVNARVMKDPRMNEMMDPNDMPFDPERMLYGGFKALVDF